MQLPGQARKNLMYYRGERVENPSRSREGMVGGPQQCFPLVVYLWIRRQKKVIGIDHVLHVSLAHAHSSVLEATTQQHDIQLV